MLRYDFNVLVKKLDCHPEYRDLCHQFKNKSKLSEASSIDNIWETLEEIIHSFAPDYVFALTHMKIEIIMSIYTAIAYELIPSIGKNELARIYSSISTRDLESIRHSLSTATSDLRESYFGPYKDFKCPENLVVQEKKDSTENGDSPKKSDSPVKWNSGKYYFSTHNLNFTNLQYLLPFWAEEELAIPKTAVQESEAQKTETKKIFSIKSFNNIDFYYYMVNCKNWSFFPENQFGMTFFKWHKGISAMFKKDEFYIIKGDSEKNSSEQDTSFEKEHSAFIFEHLFHPSYFIKNLTDYLENFKTLFSSTKSPEREKAMILTIPLSYLPFSLQETMKEFYFESLKSYLKSPENTGVELSFRKYLYIIASYKGYLFPFAESLFANLLNMVYIENGAYDLEKLRAILKNYIISNIEQYNFHAVIQNQLSKFDELSYYSDERKRKGKEIKLSTPNTEKRNNFAIETFEINYTYNYFSSVPMNDIFYCESFLGRHITLEEYLNLFSEPWFKKFKEVTDSRTPNYEEFKKLS